MRRGGALLVRRFLSSGGPASPADPYAVLGLSRTAPQKKIRERYLQLAKEKHPDVGATASASFSLISAAYSQLSHPDRRADTDAALQRADPLTLATQSADHAVAMCRAGRVGEGLSTLLGALDVGLSAHPPLVAAASEALELCTRSGEPQHASCERVFGVLLEWDCVDARAANAYFQLALRGGHMPAAMRAAKLAEARGLKQSALMQSTVRQVRRYKESLERSGGSG